MLKDSDINDEDFEYGYGMVVAKVEFYNSISDNFISIIPSEEIHNIVVMIENKEELTRWKTSVLPL